MAKWTPSGIYTSKPAVNNAAEWWRARGYEVRISKVKGGWKHYRRKK